MSASSAKEAWDTLKEEFQGTHKVDLAVETLSISKYIESMTKRGAGKYGFSGSSYEFVFSQSST